MRIVSLVCYAIVGVLVAHVEPAPMRGVPLLLAMLFAGYGAAMWVAANNREDD